jgi:WD40 repeat protein
VHGKGVDAKKRAVARVEFSPDGRRIATASSDGTARVWDLGNPDLAPIGQRPMRPNLTVDGITLGEVFFGLCHATIDPGGSRVLISGQRMSRLIDIDTGQPIGRPMTQQDWLPWTIAAFSPDGRRMASANRDVVIYDVGEDGGSRSIPLAPNTAMGRSKPLLLPHIADVFAVAFSPDGKVLASGDRNGTGLLWKSSSQCTSFHSSGDEQKAPIALIGPERQ